MAHRTASTLVDPKILGPAVIDAFAKLDPRHLMRNPVMFTVEVVATLTTILFVRDLLNGMPDLGFALQINLWLWFTVLFANFAEAVAEGRGKAQAATLRKARTETIAKKLIHVSETKWMEVPAPKLRKGDIVLVEAGDLIPSDGDVIEGVASVNEAAITGESAPVIRESGGDRSAVTGGTQVISDWIKVKVTAEPGGTFLDRMIALVEGAERQKTPNEIALNILLAGMTIIFIFSVASIPSFAAYAGGTMSVLILVALFVTLIPTTIGALLSAIGIAGMDRLVRFNVLAMSGRAVEAAGDVDTLLLDKTGTITLGNRQATAFLPVTGVKERELADAAQLASLSDETPEGRSIVVLAKEKYNIRGREMAPLHAHFIHFSAQTRISGIDIDGASIRKGAVEAILADSKKRGASLQVANELESIAARIAKDGGTPLAVARDGKLLGVIHLKDIVKGGIRDRFATLRRMGIRTVMITGDNPLTAAAIAAESGRRRLPRPSDARGQARADPQGAGAGQAGGDVRRRHQRCAGARPGRCRRGDEHRHHGRTRGRQHGRPRQRPGQAHRDRRDRQAAADDPRRADDLLDRQRRRQVLRHHPGDVRGLLSAASGAELDAPQDAAERHPVGDHLQCVDHRRADSARAARRDLPPGWRLGAAAAQSSRLRRRWCDRAVRRHQADRCRHHRYRSCVRLPCLEKSVPLS
jgi:K+-transporting ATPase ATPase B chain